MMSAFFGATFGVFLGGQNSFARLTGYMDNTEELKKYSVAAESSTTANASP